MADEQAALRRVATLVALGVPPPKVFRAVASETGRVLGARASAVARFEPDGTASVAGVRERPGMPEPAPSPRPDDDVEQRLLAFTELVAMAVANTESRAQLAASRARVVAAADETRPGSNATCTTELSGG